MKDIQMGAEQRGVTLTPFTTQEIEAAVKQGKMGKSVGMDHVSQQLLVAIVRSPGGLQSLTDFYNRVLMGHAIPQDWDNVVFSLLGKVPQPRSAEQLRPIALGSHAYKTYARAVVNRIQPRMQLHGPEQCAWTGQRMGSLRPSK